MSERAQAIKAVQDLYERLDGDITELLAGQIADAILDPVHAEREVVKVDRRAEEWLRDRHSPEWYIGEASDAEWEAAYAAVGAERVLPDFVYAGDLILIPAAYAQGPGWTDVGDGLGLAYRIASGTGAVPSGAVAFRGLPAESVPRPRFDAGISLDGAAGYSAVPERVPTPITDDMVAAALSAYHQIVDEGAYEPDEAMQAALDAALNGDK